MVARGLLVGDELGPLRQVQRFGAERLDPSKLKP
jgi:hypothetical protein